MTDPQTRDGNLKSLLENKIFGKLGRATLEAVAAEGLWATHPVGRVLFQQGQECNQLMVIVRGRITLSFASESGREIIVSEALPGDVLGDIELVLKRQRLTNGTVSEATRTFCLLRSSFVRLLQDQAFSLAVLEAVCTRWCHLAHFTEIMSLRNLEQRLAALLLDLCRLHGKPVGEGVLIDRILSQTRMAQLINASRPKVNVQLQSWKERALIAFNGNRIVVRNTRALTKIAD